MYQSETTVRVRYGETDQMGYVYYGYYATYYEVARVEAFRKLGVSYREIEAMGIIMPVLENHSKFLTAGKYDELLTIVTTIQEKPTAKIAFHYDIFNEANQLIHQGHTVLAFVDQKTGRPCRPPQAMVEVLAPFFP